MRSAPIEHNEYVDKVNNKHDKNVKKLIRQIKVWKYLRNVPISSCYLEMRTSKYMDGEKTYSPLIDLYGALRSMRNAELADMNDPTGLSSRFGACSSDSTKEGALSKLDRAVTRAERAKDFSIAGKPEKAVEQLKVLFNR